MTQQTTSDMLYTSKLSLVEILQHSNVHMTSVRFIHTISVLPMEYSQQSGNCDIIPLPTNTKPASQTTPCLRVLYNSRLGG